MKPISIDLRARILEALKEEPSSLIIAKRFKVGASSVRKLRAQMERTGSFEPGAAPGRDRLIQGEAEKRLRGIVREYPDATLNVYRELLLDSVGVAVSETTMWRQLERMDITLKKRPSERRSRTGRT